MKNLLLTVVVFSVLLLIGCQGNSITDPVSTEPINKIQITDGTVNNGSFPLAGILVLPGMGNTYFNIEGSIDYTHKLISLDPMPPAPQYKISLGFSVSAVLINTDLSGQNTWTLSSKSEDIIYVSEEGIYLLEKSFPIQGRKDGVVLVCRFLVTTNDVGLNEMWLSLPEASSNQLENKNYVSPQDTLTYPPVTYPFDHDD